DSQKLHLLYKDRHSTLEFLQRLDVASLSGDVLLPKINYKDWFFDDARRTPYTQQELHRLSQLKQKLGGMLCVDFLVKRSCLPQEYTYPIQSASQLEALVSLCSSGDHLVEKSCLLYYLARDCIHEGARLAAFAN
ncbi:hypothetical protein L0F63_001763, partial [Massospora cicadina]